MAWATAVISFLVLIVAFMQWRTAHQKVVLDLFDRRIAVYNKTHDFYLTIVKQGIQQELVDVSRFHHVRNEAAFLFGAEVKKLLEDFHVAVINMSSQAMMAKEIDSPEHGTYVKSAYAHMKEAMAIAASFETTFSPYLRMDQKTIPTPMEWLRHRNEVRKSYNDQP
ncbi:hypothetical protein NOJ05_13550 [Neorhizobium galegae]|uniref:hypothetical protein n=1 Tax=Neorhizobium galegae TaxID=399 RepID=UPI0021039CE3|nr:hypothetical protein [Neorhizobium galegae]MCQ1778227.1 hypothetical protein [Neorhizobium galegae]MCQ1796799.1 hypothetical protein [Neorhizobium galegae]